MKFICGRDVIMKEVSVAQEIVSSKNSMSILSNVLLDASEESLTIRATDLRVSFETRIPVEVSNPGTTTVFCEKLLGILRSLPSGDIEFEVDANGSFSIKPLFKKIDFQLRGIEADKFPQVQLEADTGYFELSQAAFIDMISQTIFAVSDDETRYFMNGVYMEHLDGDLVMVATDGRRLSLIKKTPEQPIDDFAGVIIPPKVLNLIRKLASGEGAFSLAVTEKNFFVQFENQRISSALIEGQFPNYRRVIPEEQTYEFTVKKDELLDALKRVSLLVEKSRRIYVSLDAQVMVLSSDESEVGVAREEISCSYDGPEQKLALNYMYLLEPLRVIDTEDVSIRFSEPTRAVSIYSSPEKDYFHIVMPMQLD
ncbi:MAG: DNA polymerase III subunit beta [Spirochaetota bacterium]